MCSWSFCVKLADIGIVRGFPLLAVVGFTVLCSMSMSFTFSLHSSMGLNPVSMLRVNFVANSFPAVAMIIIIFSLVASAMFLASSRYFGISHFML